ncbi:molybdenum cofactor biosynthesis protein MoaE [Phaeodactylibacter luteus]|uniref:Molybdopterin synthase catalytic subunit n=1 Tax=Phaeodactylibacter luteus TaxID=1564516 RepID=A0A5C6S243_9BACT|nr:molybdenum cofactor biosynthesis protein MoaE [Phaeodactylibacter luteus]TXB67930.1 molybdenum cofactor biosynthesis protein MoaE [Phaeodactylibacter luteus]
MMEIDIQLLDTPLDVARCTGFVANDEAGAINVFVGTVRRQTQGKPVIRLEFEAYEPMAIAEMRKIAEAIGQRWPALKVSFHHRTGTLQIGEVAVVIAVATPHRKASFEACEYAIDTLKQTVPIWKKEVFEDGEVWVAAHP